MQKSEFQMQNPKLKIGLSAEFVEPPLYLLFVVKVVFFGANNLVIFVALARKKDYVAWLGKHNRCLDCLVAVGNLEVLISDLDTLLHLAQNLLGIFGAGVVRCEYGNICHLCCHAAHYWSFALVAVASAAANHNESLPILTQLVNGADDILEGIRSVGEIHHSHSAIFCHYSLEAAIYGV